MHKRPAGVCVQPWKYEARPFRIAGNLFYVGNRDVSSHLMGGAKAISTLTGAKTVMGRQDVEMMHERPELTWAPEYGVPFYEDFDVDVPLDDGQVLSLGSTSIECVHTPGHTPGCFSFFFEVEEKGRMHRVGLMGGPGLNTLTDEYFELYGLDGKPTCGRWIAWN